MSHFEPTPSSLNDRFLKAVASVSTRARTTGMSVENHDVDAELKRWLNGNELPLDWSGSAVTADEWFFITTLYGEMTFEGQRTHIRKFFPSFVREVKRDVRNFTLDILSNWRLRSHWMRTRLCRMAEILREHQLTMEDYADQLRDVERTASPHNPMPAFDRIVRDHRATGWKTLSCFVRDCIQGNCFPIDSRVENELKRFGLPNEERTLVSLCLKDDLDPRRIARMFYQVGGADLRL